MLEKAVAAVKADKEKALAMFNKGEGGFKDRDLQPFCFNVSDGKLVVATVPSLLGTDVRALTDKAGKVFGQEVYRAAIEGKITEVSYMFPRPGTDPKLSASSPTDRVPTTSRKPATCSTCLLRKNNPLIQIPATPKSRPHSRSPVHAAAAT